jgi:hypothetical protein
MRVTKRVCSWFYYQLPYEAPTVLLPGLFCCGLVNCSPLRCLRQCSVRGGKVGRGGPFIATFAGTNEHPRYS